VPTKTTAPLALPLGRFLPNPKLKLREQLAEVCRFPHLSHRTEKACWHWIKGFIQFHRGNNEVNARLHPSPLSQGTNFPKAASCFVFQNRGCSGLRRAFFKVTPSRGCAMLSMAGRIGERSGWQ
jgi:hypothetical protein